MTQTVNALVRMGLSREEALTRLRDNNWDLQQAITSLAQEDASEGLNSGEEEVVLFPTQMFDHHDHDGLRMEVDNPLYTFLNDPSYKQMRDDIRANPDKAREYLETLKQTAPELHELLLITNELSLDEIVGMIQEGSDIGDSIELDLDALGDRRNRLIQLKN